MITNVLFIQGAGGYDEDAKLAASLRTSLGDHYRIIYPRMPNENNPEYIPWKDKIAEEIAASDGPLVLAGHSFGASMILKYLTENPLEKPIMGVFAASTPYWDAANQDTQEYALVDNAAASFPQGLPLFFYHARDDETVLFKHLALYTAQFPQATIREIDAGGHQLNNDLSLMAADIRNLADA
jgi:uncharacterized protein